MTMGCLTLIIKYSYFTSNNYRRSLASYGYLMFNNDINLKTINILSINFRVTCHYTLTHRMVGILEYPFLSVRPSLNLVYATSHLSFVAFYSYLVSWLAMI
jgi:hypothetical protein